MCCHLWTTLKCVHSNVNGHEALYIVCVSCMAHCVCFSEKVDSVSNTVHCLKSQGKLAKIIRIMYCGWGGGNSNHLILCFEFTNIVSCSSVMKSYLTYNFPQKFRSYVFHKNYFKRNKNSHSACVQSTTTKINRAIGNDLSTDMDYPVFLFKNCWTLLD